MCLFLTASGIQSRNGVSSHKLEAADMLNRFLLLFIIYLYGIKTKPKPICDFYYKDFLHKMKKRGGDDTKAHTFNISVHLAYLAQFIIFSGHFISFEDRKSFGTEITKHLKVQQFKNNSFIWGKKVLTIRAVREN